MTAVAERFRAAEVGPPLCALSAEDARELSAVLAVVVDFDDLPGRWQAALLQSEAVGASPAPAAASRRCCCGHG